MAPAVRGKSKATPTKRPASQQKARPNTSILRFFKKVDAEVEETLFVANQNGAATMTPAPAAESPQEKEDARTARRFNESDAPHKRRRLSGLQEGTGEPAGEAGKDTKHGQSRAGISPKPVLRNKGPFVDDSESDGDDAPGALPQQSVVLANNGSDEDMALKHGDFEGADVVVNPDDDDDDNDNDTDDDMDDEGAALGEELRERRLMQELDRLEAAEVGLSPYHDPEPWPDDHMVETCPICEGDLRGLSSDNATRHVNACLDGTAPPLAASSASAPLPPTTPPTTPASRSIMENGPPTDLQIAEPARRFSQAAIARPGQANPLETKPDYKKGNSAFSKLMSGHAEKAAWASAAAAEQASRGKQAYQRTCPFYKIMPGFSICVDAFRYGAVEGCRAYFLSHFHSDHYIGLSARWCHGPIYCSRVTGELMKQQLRVAAKWVVALEFDTRVEVPGTDGASVVMIPANHCPGSSMFLFEKRTLGSRGPSARVQRILHCGDFRACPAHVRHPLLAPETQDAISGRVKQQRIDICYLDTTYLNPRYSFPPQAQVIQACADYCAAIALDRSSLDGGDRSVGQFFSSPSTLEKAPTQARKAKQQQRLLVVCGTYSIGKERICVAIAKALKTRIYATERKIRICARLDDPELVDLLTSNPKEAQVHMQALGEISVATLAEYLDQHRPHFTRVVGLRPSGWNYRPPSGRAAMPVTANMAPSSVPTAQLLHGAAWKARYTVSDVVPQRGSTDEATCLGVPYSEHSSFRELGMFLMGLRIERVVPTVNVGSEGGRARMKGWVDRWLGERRRGGFVRPLQGEEHDDGEDCEGLWEGRDGKGGGVWW